MNVHVLGASVAGLACAAALTRHPDVDDVSVYERQSRPRAAERTGMGLMLMANGVAALRDLGAADALAGATALQSVVIRDEHGTTVFRERLTDVYCVSRAAVVDALAATLPSATINYGAEATAIEFVDSGSEFPDVAAVTFGSSTRRELSTGELLIGADGWRSPLCQELNPEFPRPRSRVAEIVMSTTSPALAARIGPRLVKTMLTGRGLAFGLIAPTRSNVIGFLQFDTHRYPAPETFCSPADLESFVRSVLPANTRLVSGYLDHVTFSDAHLWRPVDAPVPPRLHCGNAVLVGDAAHPVLPFTSQGASSALVDATTLAHSLQMENTADALDRFATTRRTALSSAVAGGRKILAAFVDPEGRVEAPYLENLEARVPEPALVGVAP